MSYYDIVFYILIYLKVLLTAMMQDETKSDVLLRYESSFLFCTCKKTATWITGIQLFPCNLHTNFVHLQLHYYQQYGIEIFSDYLGLILDSDKLEKLKKNLPQISLFCSLKIGIETGSERQP